MHLQKNPSTPDRVSAFELNVIKHKRIHFWAWNKSLLKLTDVLWEEYHQNGSQNEIFAHETDSIQNFITNIHL